MVSEIETKKESISIIIPVKNFEKTIETTFKYLLRLDYPREALEIIIADGGSTDRTIEIIKSWQRDYPFIKLVEIPLCPSPGFARNKALEKVKGDYIFFTDGDCAPAFDWIEKMLVHFRKDTHMGAVGGEVYTLRVDPHNLVEAWCEHFRFNMVSPRYGNLQEGYFPAFPGDPLPSDVAGHRAYFFGTCNVAYRKEAIEKAGRRFWDRITGEDMDFSFQLRKAGWKFYFAPQAKIDHMHRASLKSLRKVWVTYGQAHPLLIEKYVTQKRLELILQFLKKKPQILLPSPVKGFIYLGDFHLLHIFGVISILSLILNLFSPHIGWMRVCLVGSSIPFFYFLFRYIRHCFFMQPKRHFFAWCKMKYLTNLSFLRGGLKGFRRHKILCIEPSF